MDIYHKIQTVYYRDPETKHKTLIDGKFSLPAFEYLKNNEWVFTEKVDGTNIRVIMMQDADTFDRDTLIIRGKTDNADTPAFLMSALQTTFNGDMHEAMKTMFEDADVCLYGEGYGSRIQKGGGNYRSDNGFVLFDVMVNGWWLERSSIEDIASKLGLDIVPVIGTGTLGDMVDMVRRGFMSQWGEFIAEGIVARPKVELQTKAGSRIITKVKYKDFVHP